MSCAVRVSLDSLIMVQRVSADAVSVRHKKRETSKNRNSAPAQRPNVQGTPGPKATPAMDASPGVLLVTLPFNP